MHIIKPNQSRLSITLASAGHSTYLGYAHDISPVVDGKAYKDVMSFLRDSTSKIRFRHQHYSIESSILAIILYIQSKVNYTALLSSWSHSQLQSIDKIIARVLSSICYNQRSFPHALYYCHQEVGGLGISSIADSLPLKKVNYIKKYLHNPSESLLMQALLHRGSGGKGTNYFSYEIIEHKQSWLGCVAELSIRLAIRLYTPGRNTRGTTERLVTDFDFFTDRDIRRLHSMKIYIIGDLLNSRGNWISSNILDLDSEQYQQVKFTDRFQLPRIGQSWYIDSNGAKYPNSIIQITQIHTNKVLFIFISPHLGSSRRTLRIHSKCRAMVGETSMEMDIFLSLMTVRLILEPIEDNNLWLTYIERIAYDRKYNDPIQATPSTRTCIWKDDIHRCQIIPNVRCYTDGSAIDRHDPLLSILKGPKKNLSHFYGSMIFLENNNKTALQLRVIDDMAYANSAYDMELILICCACWYNRNTTIMNSTDCQSALDRLLSGSKGCIETQYSTIHDIFQQANSRNKVQWVRSHPERRSKNKSTWSTDDHGIFAADAAAADATITTIYLSNMLEDIVTDSGVVHWRNAADTVTLPNLLQLSQRYRHNNYLINRDLTSSYALPWSERLFYTTQAQLIHSKPSWSKITAACRVIYDKSYYGKNRMKGGKLSGACLLCTEQDEENLQHVLYKCTNKDRIIVRQDLLLHTDSHIMKIACDHGRAVTRIIRDAIFTCTDFFMVWCGTWHASLITLLNERCEHILTQIDYLERKSLRKDLIEILRAFGAAAGKLIGKSMEQIKANILPVDSNKVTTTRRRISSHTIRRCIDRMDKQVRTNPERRRLQRQCVNIREANHAGLAINDSMRLVRGRLDNN